jgi:Ca-activated chloride channel homolog
MKTTTIIGAMTFALGALAPAEQQQTPFRSTTQTVPIYATVINASGRLVPDLTQADFEVLDEAKPAQITNFVAEVQPIAVAVALDLSGSMVNSLATAKDAAEAFILRLLPHDRARIVTFDDRVRWSPEFTGDRDKLIHYLRTELQFGNATHLWDALYESVGVLKSEPLRKVVVVLSDGEDWGSERAGDNEVLAAAQDSDVMIYTVGLRNTYRGGPGGTMITSRPDRHLKGLSEHTGGGFFELTRATELNSTFTRVADELHRQYLLGITAQSDGKTHRLDVRVKQAGMNVRARKSYVAGARRT